MTYKIEKKLSTCSVEARHSAALTSQAKLANDTRSRDPEAVVLQLVCDESDELVHVDVDGLERYGDVAGLALERTRVVHRDELARAVVARYLALELRVVRLGDDDARLLEALLLLGRLHDYVRLDELVVRYELPEVLATPQRDDARRLRLQLRYQRVYAEEFGLFQHV